MKKISFYLLSFSILFYCAKAQNSTLGNVSISSPTAAALGKYGDYPVSYHTGVPQISLPIYTVKEGNLSLPISLSYHASGLKVQEAASWVGAGWSLNAGGVITRSIQGGPDERGTNYGGTELKGHFSDYGYNNYSLIGGYQGPQPDWQSFANGQKDGEPDLFFFNFSGYSGKFYFRDDRTPVLVPESDVKIVPYYTGSGNIQSFLIITPDGVEYSFGNSVGLIGVPPIEVTNPVTSQNGASSATVISSWYLNKISSPDNQFSIRLIYEQENYGYFTISMFPVDAQEPNPNNPYEYSLVKNIVNGVRLSKILFSNGTVNFLSGEIRTDLSDNSPILLDNVNTNAKNLSAIQVTDSGSVCKQFNLSYDYFVDNITPLSGYLALSGFASYNLTTDKKRLKLNSLQEVICNGTSNIPPYQFSYFTEQVPRRLSFGIDHWGFYNGVVNNQSLIPTYKVNDGTYINTFTGANRDANWPAMRGGALQQISYPTGGATNFDFEANSITSSFDDYQLMNITSFYVHQYGQSNLSGSSSFTVANGSGPIEITVNNTSTNFSPTYSLQNSSNTYMGGTPYLIPVAPNSQTAYTYSQTFNLAPGTYTISLSFPSNSGSSLIGGANIAVKAWKSVNVTQTSVVGGLRVRTITSVDASTATNLITNYSYGDNTSSGILYSRPVYVGIIRNDLIRDVGYWDPANGFTPSQSPNGCISAFNATYYKSPSSIRPMATTQGFHIGYSSVKVSKIGNGYSVYNYYGDSPWPTTQGDVAIRSINIASCDANAPNYPAAPLSFNYMRGELKSEVHFNQSAQKIKEIVYSPTYILNPVTTPAFIVTSVTCGGCNGAKLLGTYYAMSTAKKTQVQTTETLFNGNGTGITTTNTTYFESLFHTESTRISSLNSKNELIEQKFKYTLDYRIPNCDAIPDGIVQYNNSCNACLSSYNTSKVNCNGNSGCLSSAYLSYVQCQTNARIAYVNYQRSNFTDPINAFQTAHDNAKASASVDLKPILELQDSYINSPIETTTWKNGLITSGGFNKYDYALNPSNKVYLTQNQILSINSPTNTFTPAVVNSNGTGLIKDSRYEIDNKLKYLFGNLSEVTPRSGVTKSYLYGYNKNFPIAQVINAKSNELFHENFEETSTWSGSYAPILDYTKSHTGRASGKIVNPTGGEYVSHAPGWLDVTVTTPTKYKFSGWVYSNGPSAEIFLFMKYNKNSPQYYDVFTSSYTTNTNTWVYIQGEFSVPAGITALQLRLDNNGGGTVWFDDLRLHPSTAQMMTYTYNPLAGMTSQIDVNNQTSYFEYDGFNRLALVKDQDKNILKKYCYNYQGQTQNCTTQLFASTDQSGYFSSQNCTSGQLSEPIYVSIPAGNYNSSVSVVDANTQALQYGQNYANQYGNCITQSFDFNFYNYSSSTYYTVELYNTSTGQSYWFEISIYGDGLLGNIEVGNYDVYIYSDNNYHEYYLGGDYYTSSYGGATFYGINLGPSCNYITIN